MEIIEIALTALAAGFCALSLKKYAPETAAVMAVAAGVMIFTAVLSQFSPVAEQIRLLTSGEYAPILLKTIGICVICQFTADACRDAGQSSLGAKVEFAAKVSVLVTALPLFGKILETAKELMQ